MKYNYNTHFLDVETDALKVNCYLCDCFKSHTSSTWYNQAVQVLIINRHILLPFLIKKAIKGDTKVCLKEKIGKAKSFYITILTSSAAQ